MSAQIVYISSLPNQDVTVQLDVDDAALTLGLALYWDYMCGYWLMDVYDAAGAQLLSGVPMITGSYPAANILGQYAYLKIGSAYVLNQSNGSTDYPTSTNLGTTFVLLWSDTP
jgi:hypothetical protein